jgi:predicted permease
MSSVPVAAACTQFCTWCTSDTSSADRLAAAAPAGQPRAVLQVPLVNVALLQQHVMGWLLPPGDPVYRFVLLLEGAVPGAVTLLVVCMRVYPDIAPLSKILFWQYVAAVITLPCMLVWFIGLVEAAA